MAHDDGTARHDRWAHLRFAVVGTLLAAPPKKGELHEALTALAERSWQHPTHGRANALRALNHRALVLSGGRAGWNPVARLRRRVRRDAGAQPSMSDGLRDALRAQYEAHRSWSYQLHRDDLRALSTGNPTLGPLSSYSTVRRYMQAQGLLRTRRRTARDRPGADHIDAIDLCDGRPIRKRAHAQSSCG